jgi:nucleoid-associated protein YgaU
MRSRFDDLVQKYFTVLDLAPELGVRIDTVEMREGKLHITGEAPSEEMKNRVWDQIITVDPTYPDLFCEITVNPRAARGVVSPALIDPYAESRHETIRYTVQPGDTMESISQLFYGTGLETRRILEANRDQIKDPARLEPGTILEIP